MSERFLRLKEVQDRLAVSRTTLWRWENERGLKVVRVGNVARIRESDLQEFLNRYDGARSAGSSPGESGSLQRD